MPQASGAYNLASHIYDTFLGANSALRPNELIKNGVTITEAYDRQIFPRIEIQSQIDGRSAIQMLKKSQQGSFRLSTTVSDHEGGHEQYDIRPEVETALLDSEPAYAIGHSLFMAKLVHIALTR